MDSYVFPGGKLLRNMDPRPQRIAVLVSCGSFNPIHSAHIRMLHVAKDVVERNAPDLRVVGAFVSPVNDAYGKSGLAPFAVRAGACEVALEGDALVALDPWEGLQDAYVRSYVVLCHIREAVQTAYAGEFDPTCIDVYFVCGGDLFETFYRPNCWDLVLLKKIFEEFRLAVAFRHGAPNPLAVMASATAPITNDKNESLDLSGYAARVVPFEIEPNETSSTKVRSLLQSGDAFPDGLVSPKVHAYLVASGVYK